jgi:hypothetical protein
MVSGFTPGPWFVEHTATCGLRVVHGEANDWGFRDDITPGAFNPTEQGRANAALIAAAPALYEALEKALTWEGRLNRAEQMGMQTRGSRAEALAIQDIVNAEVRAARAALSAARPAPTEAE